MMESSPTTIAPLLLRNLVTSIFIYADNSLLHFTQKYKLLEVLRSLLVSSFLFFLRLLPSLLSWQENYPLKPSKTNNHVPICRDGDSGIARALSQLLSLVSDIPVSSRKYEIVRSLAERLIDDNLEEGFETLLEVNRTVLSVAFERTLNRLEGDVEDQENGGGKNGRRLGQYRLGRVFRTVRSIGDAAWARVGKSGEEVSPSGSCAEKLAAELLWLAQKLVACGCTEEAVYRWASASNLAWLSLSAEPRLQGSLVKVSAFLFKQAKDIGTEEALEEDESKKKQHKEIKMNMLMSWLPLLCRASNGIDAPILNHSERAELERVLEETIDMLDQEEEQEKVLSLWLHHFTYCQSSDWPNLYSSYSRWCTASRKLLLLQ